MGQYLISTDNMADFSEEYLRKHPIPRVSLSYMLEGVTYTAENSLPYKEFYARMRNGSMPTTVQVNPMTMRDFFSGLLKQTKSIIHIAFSGGLSGSYNSARVAAAELEEERKDCRITVVDSLSASLGEGLLVYKALQQQEKGLSYQELVDWVENNKLHICHNFTVDDLHHLYRGGRISRTTALFGSMINIKPILHVDNAGHLIALSKVRGRKKSIQTLADSMAEQMGSYRDRNDIVFISHGDCMEDAEYLKQLIQDRFGIQNFLIGPVGPTIGAHSGPGTLALFYMGDYR